MGFYKHEPIHNTSPDSWRSAECPAQLFVKKDSQCLYVIAEQLQEAQYVKHHIQKVCGFFLAMEQFANALKKSGHQVLHLSLDDTANFKDLPTLVRHLCNNTESSGSNINVPMSIGC